MSYLPPMVVVQSMLRILNQWEADISTLEQATQVQKDSTSSIAHLYEEASRQHQIFELWYFLSILSIVIFCLYL